MKKFLSISIVVTGVVLCSTASHAWRCGNLLVKPGVQKAAVLLYCGEPIYREQVDQYAEKLIYGPDWGRYYILTFDGARLKRIEDKMAR